MNPLRILCLHGYHGSAATLRSQMASLLAGIDNAVEFVCIDAPSLADGGFGWWHAQMAHSPAQPQAQSRVGDPGLGPTTKHYQGWARTRDHMVDVFSGLGPFDGVFGFSQGAALTSILVGLRAPDGRPTAAKPLCFDFSMMVGGFAVADPELSKLYNDGPGYQLPSLHIMGRSDRIVPFETSQRLAGKFLNPSIIAHDGGHVISSEPHVRQGVQAFLATL